jgi:hypothetical protein
MSFHSASDFEGMKRDLSELFVSTAAQFAKNIGLEGFDQLALRQMTAALDDVAGEVLMFGGDAWPESAKDGYSTDICPISGPDLEAYPSETDPPPPSTALLFTLATLMVSAPLSFLLSAIAPHGGSLFYAFGVMAVSMVFGTRYALVLAVLSPLLHNLFDVLPSLTFTFPDKVEIVVAVFYMATALVMPWAVRSSLRLRRFLGRPKPPTPASTHLPTTKPATIAASIAPVRIAA